MYVCVDVFLCIFLCIHVVLSVETNMRAYTHMPGQDVTDNDQCFLHLEDIIQGDKNIP